jgi:hypothetical protein
MRGGVRRSEMVGDKGNGAQGRNRTTDTVIFSSARLIPAQSHDDPSFRPSPFFEVFWLHHAFRRPIVSRRAGTTPVPRGLLDFMPSGRRAVWHGSTRHVNVDRTHKLIRRHAVTDAAVHDSRKFNGLLHQGNTSKDPRRAYGGGHWPSHAAPAIRPAAYVAPRARLPAAVPLDSRAGRGRY